MVFWKYHFDFSTHSKKKNIRFNVTSHEFLIYFKCAKKLIDLKNFETHFFINDAVNVTAIY